METGQIHPDFRTQKIFLKVGSFLFYGMILLLALAALFAGIAFVSQKNWTIVAVFAAMLLVSFLMLAVWRHVSSRLQTRLEAASSLMARVAPRSMAMRFDQAMGWSGYLAAFTDPATPGRRFGASLLLAKYQLPAKGEHEVEVYRDPDAPERVIVVRIKGKSVLGSELTGPALAREAAMTRRLAIGAVGLAIAVSLVGSAAMGLRWLEADRALEVARASQEWPSVRGRIVASALEEMSIPQGRSSRRGFRAKIVYRYSVNGAPFESARIRAFYRPTAEPAPHAAILARYPFDTPVEIYFDPAAPSTSVLEPGSTEEAAAARQSASYGLAAMGVATVLVAAIMLLVFKVMVGRTERFVRSLS